MATQRNTILTESDLPAGVTVKDLRAFAQADRLAKSYAAKRKILGEKIKAAFGRGNYIFESVVISRTTAMVMDAEAFQERYPAERYPQFYKMTLDVKAIPEDIAQGFRVEQERASVSA